MSGETAEVNINPDVEPAADESEPGVNENFNELSTEDDAGNDSTNDESSDNSSSNSDADFDWNDAGNIPKHFNFTGIFNSFFLWCNK